MNKTIMTAHSIRRDAANQFGGKPGQYSMAIACQMAKEQNNEAHKMEKEYIKTASWKTTSGLEVVATATLTLRETLYADGNNVEVDYCEKSLDVTVEGIGSVGNYVNKFKTPQVVNGYEAVANVGKLALNADGLRLIQDIVADVENHPAWAAKIAAEKNNREEIAKMEARRNSNGYCHKCGSYCYGDCAAN